MIENIKMLDTIPESNTMAESYRSITQTGIAFLKEKFDLKKQKQGPFFLMLHVLQTLLSELPAGTPNSGSITHITV